MKHFDFERSVIRNREMMFATSLRRQMDMGTRLTRGFVAETFQRSNQFQLR